MGFLKHNSLHEGDSQSKMLEIESGSIALSFWSPPYFVGKHYEENETYNSWQALLKKVVENHSGILKPGGFMVINIADILCFKDEAMPKVQVLNLSLQKSHVTRKDVLEAQKQYPELNRYQLAELLGCSEQTIDRRLHGNNIRGGKYALQTRVQLVGEQLNSYASSVGLYLYDKRIWVKDPAWANSKWTTNTLKGVDEYEDLYIFWKPGEFTIDRRKLTKSEWTNWGKRRVWHIPSVSRNDDHEAKFPVELARRVIRLYSEEGDLVLDPFVGSGTTVIAAAELNRNYLGIDKEKKYVDLAEKNISRFKSQMKLI
jgi:DNA modification methylase|tara:strand:- start:24 stop:965 length:942 start_codon:yes stop_codon:yes gene_type:complete